MRQKPTRDLYAYWNGLRGERAAPERAEVDPAALGSMLGDTFMLEVDAARRYPMRISATWLNRLFDCQLRGRSFIDLCRAQERVQMARLCATVSDDTVAIVAGLTAAPAGEAPVSLEMLLLPLRHRGKTHARIIGTIVPAGVASWEGLVPVAHVALVSMRIVDARGAGRLGREPSGHGERRLLSLASLADCAPVARRGHLSLYQGGKASCAP